ncbi:MAG: DUF3089 domain-containing protein [Allobaculum sp.]|nr:DUF3089 domain-containing protein [Allobaculum sp.]
MTSSFKFLLATCLASFMAIGCQSPSTLSPSTTSSLTSSSISFKETLDLKPTDYSQAANWAYLGIGEDKEADVFLVCPTIDMKEETNMSLEDEENMASFLGALNMERGIYEEATTLYAPYYQQAAMMTYDLDQETREAILEVAYQDVSNAFAYYLAHYNQGRPIVLAGFSQGADMCYRLMMEYFDDPKLQDQLVATYAIGWALTQEMVDQYPQLKAAQEETDTGVIITFECEDESIDDTFILPAGIQTLSINPLNWKTDSTPASKEENEGACFTDYEGNILEEDVALCGAYLAPERGSLKVTDIVMSDFPAGIPNLPEGSYHLYDYQFFYRNLQENVQKRLDAYLSQSKP